MNIVDEAIKLLTKILPMFIFKTIMKTKLHIKVIPTFRKLRNIKRRGWFSALKASIGMDHIVSKKIIIPIIAAYEGFETPKKIKDRLSLKR